MTWAPMSQEQLDTVVMQMTASLLINEDRQMVRAALEKTLRLWDVVVVMSDGTRQLAGELFAEVERKLQ